MQLLFSYSRKKHALLNIGEHANENVMVLNNILPGDMKNNY
jgi:hypothetical protein